MITTENPIYEVNTQSTNSATQIDTVRLRPGYLFVVLLVALSYIATPTALGDTVEMTNDDPNLQISTDYGDRILEYDFDSFNVGIAEYSDGPTGTTVFHFPEGARAAVDIRGGAPGFIGDYGFVHAISLAGGSLLGLEAASGVASGILARNGYTANWEAIPLVSGGIIFDFGPRDNSIYPDKRLGRAAFENAQPNRFPLGARGAGISATVGKMLGFDRLENAGQGAAFVETGGIKVFACVVLNAVGAVVDREGQVVRGHLDPETGDRISFMAAIEQQIADAEARLSAPPGNTTLAVVITNQSTTRFNMDQLARQVHSSMARAIQPFQTDTDGDTLWFVSTGEIDIEPWSGPGLGTLASEVVWDAVLAAHP
ncbi:MAG: P1 family peptidase [Gammaproteobacteria bacterium]|nr:P1 family peptidase [Gammaproteobacteria bacterium]